ncbi:hypothetical protein B566_EDAN006395 [Ephemera danica]|nr:hypothetical protein B566_EDAN006395 [Ephemera danica]
MPQFSAEREYIHDKRLRLLTMGLEPPRRFIGDGNQFSLHEFLIAQAQFLMDMPGYDPENDFPLRKIYDLKTMKYKAKTDGAKPKIDSKDDSSPKQFNVQDSMDTKDDTTLQSLQSTQTDDDYDSRLLKEEPISDMLNEEDMQNPEQDEDDSQNADEEADLENSDQELEEDLENSDQELEEDLENSDQDDDGSRNADTDEDGTDNEWW